VRSVKKLLAKAKEAVGIDSVSGKSFSDDMKVVADAGATNKRLVAELHTRLQRQAALLEQLQAAGAALGDAFGEQSDALAAQHGKLAGSCAAAKEWQARTGEFEFSLRHGVQTLAAHCRSWLDTELVAAKQKERVYDSARKALESAEATMRKAGAPPNAAVERDNARRVLERDEEAALAAWRHANARATALLEASLSTYWKNQASFFKQGALFFADKRKDADSIFASTVSFEPSAPAPSVDADAPSGATTKAAAAAAAAAAVAPVFGEPLGDTVPSFFPATIAYLEEHALHSEGLLRISGSSSIVQQFKAQVNAGQMPQFHPMSDHHNASGLLKMYLREMSEPLCTYALYDDWVKATEIANEAERLAALRSVWQSLPRANRDMMQMLLTFCSRLAERASDNKMSPSNIAIVIGPPIMRCKADGDGPGLASDMNAVNRLATDLVVHASVVFGTASRPRPSIASAVAELDNIDDLLAEADAAAGLDPASVAANLSRAALDDGGPTQYSGLPMPAAPGARAPAAPATPDIGARDTYGQLPKTGSGVRSSRPASGFSAPVNKNPFARPATSTGETPGAGAPLSPSTTGPKSFKSLMQASGIVAMVLERSPASFPQSTRDEALKVARDVAKHVNALGADAPGADSVLAEGNATVQLLSSGGSLDDARAHARRLTCAVHDLICSKENAVHQAIAQRATEVTHATAGDISALLRNAIAKQDAPEQRESAKRNCALLEALMVARSLQVDDPSVLADVTVQSSTVRRVLNEFLGDIALVSTAGAVDSATVEGLKVKAKAIITALKQLSQDVLGATSKELLAGAGEEDDALAEALGAACEAAAAALPARDEQLRVLAATQVAEPLLALAKQAHEQTLSSSSVVAALSKLTMALGLPQQGAAIGELGGDAVGWFSLRNAQLAVAAAQLKLGSD
jgi:hypothetical protein